MIAHAWTALCDRCVVDRDTDNLSLDTLEVIYVNKPDDGVAALVPCRLEVVSLWYRQDPDHGGTQRVHVCILSPDLVPLAYIPIDVDLRLGQRLRTRCVIDGLLVQRPGTYFITVDVLESTPAREVARIPLQVELATQRRPPSLAVGADVPVHGDAPAPIGEAGSLGRSIDGDRPQAG